MYLILESKNRPDHVDPKRIRACFFVLSRWLPLLVLFYICYKKPCHIRIHIQILQDHRVRLELYVYDVRLSYTCLHLIYM